MFRWSDHSHGETNKFKIWRACTKSGLRCSIFQWIFSVEADFLSKDIFSNFDLKLCVHQRLSETSLHKKFKKLRTNSPRNMNLSKYTASIEKHQYFERLISRREFVQNFRMFLCKLVSLRRWCTQSFRSKFENMTLLRKSASTEKIHWKIQYLGPMLLEARHILNFLVSQWEWSFHLNMVNQFLQQYKPFRC